MWRSGLCLLLLLPSCPAAQSLPSSAWERRMRSKNHKGATHSPMSSSLFSLLSQSSSLLPYSSSSSPCCPSHFAGCTEHFAPLLPCCALLTVCLFCSPTQMFFFPPQPWGILSPVCLSLFGPQCICDDGSMAEKVVAGRILLSSTIITISLKKLLPPPPLCLSVCLPLSSHTCEVL